MRIPPQHRPWLLGVLAAAGVATALYVTARRATTGVPGGTWPGLALGTASAALIGGVSLLGARRRFPRLPLGAVASWLRGHLWLALLSLLLALYHAGFHLGGLLTTTLVMLLFLSVASGVVGALLQHILPGAISARAATEWAEDPRRATALARRQAYEVLWASCGDAIETNAGTASTERETIRELLGEPPRPPASERRHESGSLDGQQELAQFYSDVMLPFLRGSGAVGGSLVNAADATLAFDALAAAIAVELHPAVQTLSELCEAVRQARRQLRMQGLLHGWLLAHIPLAMALLVLLVVHAVTALRY